MWLLKRETVLGLKIAHGRRVGHEITYGTEEEISQRYTLYSAFFQERIKTGRSFREAMDDTTVNFKVSESTISRARRKIRRPNCQSLL
jgi:hypothetical protein